MIKYIPNTITLFRIAGSFALLLLKPFSSIFFFIYVLCGISDMLDGFIARKTNTASSKGSILDSIADTVFIGVILFLVIPVLPLKFWMLPWISGIFMIRLFSFFIGFIKFRTLAWLHTYANKVTGFLLFCFPILWKLLGLSATISFLCIIASFSALEELVITITSKELYRNSHHL